MDETAVALPIRALQPLERLVFLSPPGINLGGLIWILGAFFDQFAQRLLRFRGVSECVFGCRGAEQANGSVAALLERGSCVRVAGPDYRVAYLASAVSSAPGPPCSSQHGMSSRRLRNLRFLSPIHYTLSLKSGAPSTAISIYQEGNHNNSNDQSDRTNSPTRAHTPIQTSSTTKQ